ncbi:MAG: hypothetical protein UV73_C0002G0060 [Candidatus Gottesmanbacteria bacterium GW2011_GWA2_43_14]|uniref:DUF192 domain-containing protein n=1 Tax=Candidatus Gottesmanbacteria bacterium GW2011_GWA2_43_14 TaxID=1618443 RepID=A0A0G1FTJ1_9BACT|nr:MAG: hypothetical protein UV73_C0002G0060 [Candidatus Gottesmanbacteria bacterium GW2011_GWA2_43_14]
MKKYLLIIPVILVLLTVYLKFFKEAGFYSRAVINGRVIKLLVADTPSKRNRGLSFRESLSRDTGMLFIFDKKEAYSFWMNEMKFPLDFLWIDGVLVTDLSENIPPPDGNNIETVTPQNPVDKVLEVNSGIIKELEIKIGDRIIFK